ncbi:Ribosomal protein S1 [Cinnamomum micranthum f. kanehirae]|uniref:Ribosomal protein S1 n=1 Tax=Cinnamomum micranthum f. kanehirae TaxID=337451 RepID=A0A443PXZ2_9MAGN|nr:Ribosomal protein S1 [Cinnamomum micranthum f. kanehirae]
MPIHLCNSLSFFNFPSQLLLSRLPQTRISEQPISNPSFPITKPSKIQSFFQNPPLLKRSHAPFSSTDDRIDEISKPHELELLGKPSPILVDTSPPAAEEEEVQEPPKPEIDEALAPFLKFFKPTESSEAEVEAAMEEGGLGVIEEEKGLKEEVKVEYYEPKPGDFVVGVVVSGNENRLDVNVGADLLGTMLTKEVLPLYDEEMSYVLCDLGKDAEEFLVPGKIGIVKEEESLSGERVQGRPVVETGTVIFAEVLGRTLSGRPLLSTRRLFRRVAWHRVRQIKQLNEPIEVRISEWNTGGLLTRIEGLRAFLPKAELMGRVNTFTDLKENVGRRLSVMISRIDEAKNDLIISEREAWEMLHLQEGALLEGTVCKIFPFGAQVRIGETNRSGLLHISNITRSRVSSVGDLLAADEKVKVLVVKSMFPDKISLSIADLESEPGLFLSNKEKVFSEAEEMAKRYRRKLPVVFATRKLDPFPAETLPFDDESRLYSNWKWFKFERVSTNLSRHSASSGSPRLKFH